MTDVWHLHGVHPIRPEVNGKSFDEISGLSPEVLDGLCERELVFITTFVRNGKTYGGSVIARDWDQAQAAATARGLGEEIEGILCGVTPG